MLRRYSRQLRNQVIPGSGSGPQLLLQLLRLRVVGHIKPQRRGHRSNQGRGVMPALC